MDPSTHISHRFSHNFVAISLGLVVAIAFALAGPRFPDPEARAQPAAGGKKKAEAPAEFVPAVADPVMGDWQGQGEYVAQVLPVAGGKYQVCLLKDFDTENNLVAVLEGTPAGNARVKIQGDGWQGAIHDGHFTAGKGDTHLALHRVMRKPPSLGAPPPAGAVVLFDGSNLDAWAKKKGKDWLTEDGPARWKLVEGGAVEVVPGSDSIITHQKFGDCKLHVEFRTLGFPTNSGVYLQTRYELNINETYGRHDLNPNANFDNCTENARPRIRPSLSPLAWQTFDIDFQAPRFDAAGKLIAKPRATVYFNGVKIYDRQELDRPHGAAERLGEAPTGPLMLQEHGMPLQFRNIWLVETNSESASAAPSTGAFPFHHPGVLVNRAQLDLIKERVTAGIEPQKTAFEAMKASPLGARDYEPRPRAVVECGPHSDPDLGCKDEQRDSEAAYTQALLWSITGDKIYAGNAIKIMNAWASTLKGGHKLSNGQVQAAWCGEVWPRAAEIIRYSNAGWAAADVAAFQAMLTTQYLSSLLGGSCENGNKELSIAEAIINIGVFNDDPKTFEHGLTMWRGRAPAYIYLKSDGPTPVQPANCDMTVWGNKGFTTPLVDGLLQETMRDSQHANMGFSAMVNAAETARQQGIDLYAEQGQRIMAALEFQAQFLEPNNALPPPHVAFNKHPTWEIAYNHFHNRLGHDLPKMKAVLPTNRPTGVNHHMAWETLTHGAVGAVGLPPLVPVAR
jgi:hypothetical protein